MNLLARCPYSDWKLPLLRAACLHTAVTESQTASSFLQLLTNVLHDQHQIYNFISQNKTIMAAPVRNSFSMMLGGRAKEVSNSNSLP